MKARFRAVFDANVFVQGVLSRSGPAALCLDAVRDGIVELLVTPSILQEVEEVLVRLSEKPRFADRLPREAVSAFLSELPLYVTIAPEPDHVWDLPRDPDDEVYLDLAITAGAAYLTTRDQDLLSLRDDPAFTSRHPEVSIVTATEFLQAVASGNDAG